MATRSATSTTKSNAAIKTFVTFRVAGDALDPGEVTALFKTSPTHQHKKGEEYSTGKANIVSKTGVWFFSTEGLSPSKNIFVHLKVALAVLIGTHEDQLEKVVRLLRFRDLLEQKQLTATMTLFWYGRANSAYPSMPSEILLDLFKLIPIHIEYDFDRDEDSHPSRLRAA